MDTAGLEEVTEQTMEERVNEMLALQAKLAQMEQEDMQRIKDAQIAKIKADAREQAAKIKKATADLEENSSSPGSGTGSGISSDNIGVGRSRTCKILRKGLLGTLRGGLTPRGPESPQER